MLFSILIFVLTLIVLILIHELGHFLMAKKFGIKVEEFGVGLPPRIWGKKIGETIYSVNLIPFGGFVRLLGEDETDKKVLGNPRSFGAKKPWQKILVVVAGVTMNLILAWVIFYTVIIAQGFRVIYPTIEPAAYIGRVQEGFPAKDAGIKSGDKIVSVEGTPVKTFEEARNIIKAQNGEEVSLTVTDMEGKSIRDLKITPRKTENGEYLLGVVFSPIPFKEYVTTQEKIFSAVTYSYHLTKLTFQGLGKTLTDLFSGQFNTVSQSVSGPVGIATISSNILSGGLEALIPYLWFIGVISLTLAIFNVLPIPAVDGGRLFFLIIEFVFKRKVRAEIEAAIHNVGFVVLIALAVLVTFSDIKKLLP